MIELKNCTFCGGKASVYVWEQGGVCVICEKCHCQTMTTTDAGSLAGRAVQRVVEKWNNRIMKIPDENNIQCFVATGLPTPGAVVHYHGHRFVVLGEEQGGLLVISEKPLPDEIPFDENEKADWKNSTLREFLNGEYLQEIGGPDGLIRFTSDLTADDGTNAGCTSEDYVFLLSDTLYRKYRGAIPEYKTAWWTITPFSSNLSSVVERSVDTSGALGNDVAYITRGVVPSLLLDPKVL